MHLEETAAQARRRMVETQLFARGVRDARVLAAMERIPRERFVEPAATSEAYDDRALSIACEQTISQPYIVARMTEALRLTGDEHVLEIGGGSGYQTAILAELCAHVVTIERHEDLARVAEERLRALGYRNITSIVGDGALGWPDLAPYDGILVAAAARAVPAPLFEQLREGGVLVIPLDRDDGQMLYRIRKDAGEALYEELTACRFVPFVGA